MTIITWEKNRHSRKSAKTFHQYEQYERVVTEDLERIFLCKKLSGVLGPNPKP